MDPKQPKRMRTEPLGLPPTTAATRRPSLSLRSGTHSPGKGGFGLLATRASRFQEKAGINHAPDIPRK